MVRGRVVSLVCALVVAAGLVGCGSSGSSSVTPTAYARSICSAVGPFLKDVATRSSALNLATHPSPAEGKTALQGFLAGIATDTSQAVSKLKQAGTPSVSNGKAIADAITGAFRQLGVALTAAVTQAQSLPTSSPQAFALAAHALGANVQSSMSGIGQSLNGLKSPALEAAARKVPECQTLGG